MNIYALLILIASILMVHAGCNKSTPPPTEPPPPDAEPTIHLSLEGKTCTEAWIKLNADGIDNASVYQNDSLILNLYGPVIDTTLYQDHLLPNTNYEIKLRVEYNERKNLSRNIHFQTLDTTSHNFTYQVWEFGDYIGSSSFLYDVAIINENDIWAVGEIYMTDSAGNEISYNAMHWNGNDWEYKRLLYKGGFWRINTVIGFASNDILFTCFMKFDGNTFIELPIPNALSGWNIYKLFGRSAIDLYAVGDNGSIVYFNGSNWQKQASGTDLDLVDVCGDDKGNVYVAGIDYPFIKGVILKRDARGSWEKMIEAGIISPDELFTKLYGRTSSVWTDENGTLYAAGDFLYEYKNDKWKFVESLPENHLNGNQSYIGFVGDVKGTKSNNIVLAGGDNTLRHFNGLSWSEIGIPYTPIRSIAWHRTALYNNIVAAVGREGRKAIIILLKS